jgi:DHA1 family tetracycline resistance protein-like MFS transporter
LFGYFTKADAPVTFAGAPFLMAAVFILLATIVFLLRVRTSKSVSAGERSTG